MTRRERYERYVKAGLHDPSVSLAELARRVGVSIGAAHYRRRRYPTPLPPLRGDDRHKPVGASPVAPVWDELLPLLKDRSLSASGVARRFGLTPATIIRYRSRLGVPRWTRPRAAARWHEEIDRHRHLLVDITLSCPEVAARSGLSRDQVWLLRRTLGIRRPRGPAPTSDFGSILGNGMGYLPDEEVGKKIGLSRARVHQIRKRLGIPAATTAPPPIARELRKRAEKRLARAIASLSRRNGWSAATLKVQMGISERGIRRIARDHGIELPAKTRVPPRKDYETLSKAYDWRLPNKAIARIAGGPDWRIAHLRQRLRRLGFPVPPSPR